MIAKNPAIPNKKSWFRGFLSRLKVFFSSPPPELDESHAATRYRVAYMTREEWEEYEGWKTAEKDFETCSTCSWNHGNWCSAPIPRWVYGFFDKCPSAANIRQPYGHCELYKSKKPKSKEAQK